MTTPDLTAEAEALAGPHPYDTHSIKPTHQIAAILARLKADAEEIIELKAAIQYLAGKHQSTYLAQAEKRGRAAGLEAAAKMCDRRGGMRRDDRDWNLRDECDNLAHDIRALLPPTEKPAEPQPSDLCGRCGSARDFHESGWDPIGHVFEEKPNE